MTWDELTVTLSSNEFHSKNKEIYKYGLNTVYKIPFINFYAFLGYRGLRPKDRHYDKKCILESRTKSLNCLQTLLKHFVYNVYNGRQKLLENYLNYFSSHKSQHCFTKTYQLEEKKIIKLKRRATFSR